jgi:hypothetical protein
LASGKQVLPQFANTKQRVVEVFVRRLRQRPLLVQARGIIYSFDEHGRLDMAEGAEAAGLAIEGSDARATDHNVLDIEPVLHHRRWMDRHTWKVPKEIVRQISADVSGASRLPLLRL